MTQYFFNPDAYFAFVDEVRAKVWKCTDRAGHPRSTISPKLARAFRPVVLEIPRWLRLSWKALATTAHRSNLGLDVVTALCENCWPAAHGLGSLSIPPPRSGTIWQRPGL